MLRLVRMAAKIEKVFISISLRVNGFSMWVDVYPKKELVSN